MLSMMREITLKGRDPGTISKSEKLRSTVFKSRLFACADKFADAIIQQHNICFASFSNPQITKLIVVAETVSHCSTAGFASETNLNIFFDFPG